MHGWGEIICFVCVCAWVCVVLYGGLQGVHCINNLKTWPQGPDLKQPKVQINLKMLIRLSEKYIYIKKKSNVFWKMRL